MSFAARSLHPHLPTSAAGLPRRVVRHPLRSAIALSLLGASVVGGAGACDDTPVGTVGIAATSSPSSLAILSSDYTITSVSLYSPVTGRLVDACITSATKSATLTQPLSGNVVLPTQAQGSGELVLIDSKAAVLTFVKPDACAARGQLSVSTGGFKANPHDLVTLSASKAYVTRYETNLDATPDAADFDDGDDLLIVDPKALTVTGRIALAPYAVPGPAPTATPTQARPDRALLAGGLVYVSLNNISGDFGTTGTGRVVIVDPTTDTVVGTIDLPAQRNCSGLTYVAATQRLYIACGGAYGDPVAQVAESALVEVDVSGALPVVTRALPAGGFGPGALNFFYATVSGDATFTGTLGLFSDSTTGTLGTSDVFYFAPLSGVAPTKLVEGAAGDLGVAVVDPASNKAFLADASFKKPRVHVFNATTGAALATSDFEPDPSAHLPPRAIAAY